MVNLVAVEEALAYARTTSVQNIVFRIRKMDDACFIAHGDSSRASAPGFKSQAGLAFCLAEKGALSSEGGTRSLLTWRSCRLKRVCRLRSPPRRQHVTWP